MSTVKTFVKDDIRLPSAPGIAVRILDIVQREDFSFNQLAAVFQSDPALVTRILRLVNSGFYCLPNKVGAIDMAVTILGANAVKNIALSFTISAAFRNRQAKGFNLSTFWKRSAVAAAAAQLISEAIRFRSDEVFIAALLQDIGVATMFTCGKEDYTKVLERKAVTRQPLAEVEMEICGFDHTEVGCELLREWGLPESIYLPIRHHHNIETAPASIKTMCNILGASDSIAKIYCGSETAKSVESTKEMLSTTFGIDGQRADSLIDAVAERSVHLLSQLDIDSTNLRPFSQILEDANKELSRLNLSYEMLVVEYKQAKEKAEHLAIELQTANEKLRELAFRDGLTGLYNHRFFQESIDKEIARAERYKRPFAVMMFDLDHFKKVNDTYGHQRGDTVLKALARLIEETTRKTDIVARYGGEEFVVILPETNHATARSKAEACRAAVEKMQIQADGTLIRATISVGLATYDPARAVDKNKLIEAADKALYKSKQAGRNRVTSEE